ncbi:MAG: hypothetical protein ACE5HV_00085 [Acidobacteriota bacterium]
MGMEFTVFSVLLPDSFDLDRIRKVLPDKTFEVEVRGYDEQKFSWRFWESIAGHIARAFHQEMTK